MAKWRIPRHWPIRVTDDQREAANCGKRRGRVKDGYRKREAQRKADEYARYREQADLGDETAAIALGTCVRKTSISTLARARKAAIATWFETGATIWVYGCPLCGGFHLTAHPIPGAQYLFSTAGTGWRRKC